MKRRRRTCDTERLGDRAWATQLSRILLSCARCREACQAPDSFLVFVCFTLFFVSVGFLCVALAVLELPLQTGLASNSEIHLPLPPECWGERRWPPRPSSRGL